MPHAGRTFLLRSITVIPALLDLRQAATATDCGGVSELWAERGYTSMRDLIATTPLAAAFPSPGGGSGDGWRPCDIPIRNRLVKQAARAYLLPMAAAARSPRRRGTLRRIWTAISCGLTLGSCFDFVRRLIGAIRRSKEL